MKHGLLVIASTLLLSAAAQTIDRSQLYGNWQLEGVLIRNQLVSFWNGDTLARKLFEQRRIEQPHKPILPGDSMAMEMGAHFLCETLNNLGIQIGQNNQMLFQFAAGKTGSQDIRNHVLKFEFQDDKTLLTTDERGYKSDLKIEKLSATHLTLSGISSARYMKLRFKKE